MYLPNDHRSVEHNYTESPTCMQMHFPVTGNITFPPPPANQNLVEQSPTTPGHISAKFQMKKYNSLLIEFQC